MIILIDLSYKVITVQASVDVIGMWGVGLKIIPGTPDDFD